MIGEEREPAPTLNPMLMTVGTALMRLSYSCLLKNGPHWTLEPDLAARVPSVQNGDLAKDGMTIVYHLRRGVIWQDGAPFDARDLAFTFNALFNPQNNFVTAFPYDDVASLKVLNDYTVRIRLHHPYSPMIDGFFADYRCSAILPAHILGRYPNMNDVPFNTHPIGTGPYKVVSWKRGDRLVYVANALYFGGPPKIHRIIDEFMDGSAIVAGLKTGEVDAAFRLSPVQYANLIGTPGLRFVKTPMPSAAALEFNLAQPIVNDRGVRLAVISALNIPAIARSLSHGLYDPEHAMRAMFGWAYDPKYHLPTYDPQRAKALLDAMGWRPGPDGVRAKGGQRLQLLLISSNDGMGSRVVVLVQAQLAAVGIAVEIKTYSPLIYYAQPKDGGPVWGGHFQMMYIENYFSPTDPDTSRLFACIYRHDEDDDNNSRYCNPALDRANDDALRTTDRERKRRDYKEVQRILMVDLPWLLLWQTTKIDVMTDRLHGFEGTPTLLSTYHAERWWLDR